MKYRTIVTPILMIFVLVLATATFVEKYRGSSFVGSHVYGSWWFVGILTVISISLLIYIIQQKIYRHFALFLIHLALVIILAGGLMTFATAKQGMLHLQMNELVNTFTDHKNHTQQRLPFDISLADFQIVFYDGTQAPANYVSHVIIHKNGEIREGIISMNKLFSVDAFRFYLSGYDRDGQGVTLIVKRDRYGLSITYLGYVLLLIGMVAFFFSKKSKFRELLQHPALKKGAMLSVFLGLYYISTAETITLPEESAQKFAELQMIYRERITPIQTYAQDFTLKLYGKPKYKNFTPEQILLGWILYPEKWTDEPMIKVKSKKMQKMIGIDGKYASFTDFFTEIGEYKLAEAIHNIYFGGQMEGVKEIIAIDEKIQLIFMLQMGASLTIFPIIDNGSVIWFSPADDLPDTVPEHIRLLVAGYFEILHEYIADNDLKSVELAFDQLKKFQRKTAGDILPSQKRIKAEIFYNRLNITNAIAFLNVLLGIFSLLYYFKKMGEKIEGSSKVISTVLLGLLLLSSLAIIFLIGLRGYISGAIPLGNGAATMQFLAVCIIFTALIFRQRFPLFLPFGFLFSGIVLIVSGMGAVNPQITQLQPVLISPLLSIHVSLIMMAYALFGFITLNALLGLLMALICKLKSQPTPVRSVQLAVISKILLYPALFLMIAGIVVGAVWAEVSWGNYWSWDPKEVWALITVIIYAIALYSQNSNLTKYPLLFHGYLLFAFLSVLMTYFGVNLVLGGMHSYG